MARKWTRENAERYINKIENIKGCKGLTYWSAMDYLSHHKVMNNII